MELQIEPAPRSEADIEQVLLEVNNNHYIGQLQRERLDALVDDGYIRFFYSADTLVGFGAWSIINANWLEYGPIYVADAARGKGYGREIIRQTMELTATRNRYGVTKNPIIRHIFEQYEFIETPLYKLPPVIRAHIWRKLSWRRMLNLTRKLDLKDHVSHHIWRYDHPSIV